MNRALMIWLSVAALAMVSAHGQGFVNLDFKAAQIVPISTNADGSVNIAATNALPGWSAFTGTNQLSLIRYNAPGSAEQPPGPELMSRSSLPSGDFAVVLGTGSISQTALIPADTQSLLFDVLIASLSRIVVTLNDRNVPCVVISNGVNSQGTPYTIFGADISAFAGQTDTLSFSGTGIIDDIQFYSQPIPEPSAPSLIFAAGGVLASLRARRWTPLVRSRQARGYRT